MIIVVYAVHILYYAGSQNYCKDAYKSIHKPAFIWDFSSVGLEHQPSKLKVIGLSPISLIRI